MDGRCILEQSLTIVDIEGGLSLKSCMDDLPEGGKSPMKLKVLHGERVWEFDYVIRQRPGFYGTAWDKFATAANLQRTNILRLYAEEADGVGYRIEIRR